MLARKSPKVDDITIRVSSARNYTGSLQNAAPVLSFAVQIYCLDRSNYWLTGYNSSLYSNLQDLCLRSKTWSKLKCKKEFPGSNACSQMSANFDDNLLSNNHESSPISSPVSSSSSPSSSSEGSSSSSELNPSDALQSPLTGLLNFEGFSMPQIRNFGISRHIDMPNFSNLPSLPALPSFNIPNFQQRLPDLANNLTTNLTNLQNFTPNMPNFRNLSYLSQLTNVYTSAEIQSLFNLFRISTNGLPALPQFPPLFSRGQLLKSWPHLKDSVRNMHRRLNDITQRFPTNFHFQEWQSKNDVNYIRIYFLLNDFIYYCDSPTSDPRQLTFGANSKNNVTNHQPSPSTSLGKHQLPTSTRSSSSYNNKHEILNTQPLHPNNMLVENFAHVGSYEYDQKNSRFVFAINKFIYYFDDHPEQDKAPHAPYKIETECYYSKTDLRICPSNPDLISYHCNGDIWCVNIKTSQEVRLTSTGNRYPLASRAEGSITRSPCSSSPNGISNDSQDECNPDALPILVGRPSYVIREEFGRLEGFWWKPEPDYYVVNNVGDFSEHQLLYEETDQSNVGIVSISSWDGTKEEQRYPKTGTQNAISHLGIIKFKVSARDSVIHDVVTYRITPDLRDIFPECEYLVRVGWLGQEAIWCQLLNRSQTHLVLAIISLSKTFEPQIVHEEKSESYWISAHDNLYFLPSSRVESQPLVEGSELLFLWSSKETGFRHLYLFKVQIGSKASPTKLISKKQLTEGQWEVNEKDLWVDEEEMLVYFCGLRDTPLERQLYVLSYADCIEDRRHSSHVKTKVHRLTELNYTQCSIAFNASCSVYVNIQSNTSVPPFGFVNIVVPPTKFRRDSRRLPDSRRLALLLVNSFNYSFFETSHFDYLKSIGTRPSIMYDCQADLLPGLAKPELFCCKLTNGDLIYGSVFKPEFMESGVRYPTVLEVYGGPEIQLVSNNFMSLRQPTRHLLSSEGYVVVLIDCRGSGRRGVTFEAHTYRRMGQVEIADQIEVLKWLAKNTGYIDLDRVAVKGWSYGGYLALMALAQYPKVFKVAIAGAPVTNWLLYDTAYTERFMGMPNENPDGYFKGNVLNYAHLFPDQENRLLLLHGLMDENVHFTHTISLIKALIEAGKPYDLQVFPVERHILKNPTSCENYMTCVLSYLQLNL